MTPRFTILGFHFAITWNKGCRGIAVWPPGKWPKEPWVYNFWQKMP